MDTPGTSYQSLTAQLAAAQQELSALRVAYGRTQRILNHLPDGVTVQDAAGILVYANAAAAHLAGFPNAAAMLQAPAATLWSGVELHDAAGHPITPGQLPGQRVLLGDQEPPPMTIGVRSGSRETQQWAAMRAMPLRDAHGQVEGVMTICHDVTNRMLRERAVFAATLAAVPDAVVVTDVHGVITDANPVAESLLGQSAQHMLGQPLDQLIRPAMADGDRGDLLRHDRPALAAHLDEGTAIPVELHTSPIHDAQGDRLGAVQIIRAVRGQPADEPRLTEHAEVLTVINQTGQLLAAELDLQTLVQAVTDATTSLIGAEFGSFFYNVRTADGDAYTLYTIAGVPREAFATFPMPRNTKIFSPTFEGTGIVRSDDITQDPRYGQNPPYHGMPPGHLPVRSYLAVPVISRLGEVIGGLFFGHSQTGVFTARSEQLIVGLVSQTAIAMDNARLYAAAQAEIIQRAQAEQHLRLITDTLPVLVAYVTPAHTYHFVNQAYESWFGAPRDRIIGQDLRMMAGEAAYTAIREYVERALAGETVMYERMITLKTGAVRTIQATYIPDQDDQGAVRGFVSLIMDITQRKQDEDALRMHAHILDSMSEGVSVSDEAGIIIYTNPAEDALFGYPRGALLGRHVSVQNAYSPDENRQVVAEVIDHLQREGRWSGEFANIRQDGTPFFTAARISRLILGERQHWVCVQHDSTVEKARAAERAQLLIREQHARREAEAANRLKDDFLAVLSHELRTPMTAILGYGQLIQRRGYDADYTARTLTKMMQSATVQMQLIEDLLDMSRIITGKLLLHVAPLDLATVVGAAIDTVRPALDAKGIVLDTRVDPAACALVGDAARLQQVVWNLLANAVKFTPAQGRITVQIDALPEASRLEVTDTGQGISPDVLPYIFDRFRQGERALTRSMSGLGLGLSIVRHLVELHGGTVHATSAGEGCGTTLTILLPRPARPAFTPVAADSSA